MISFRDLLARISSSFRKRELDRELNVELDSHLEMAIEDNIKRGLSPEEARRVALIKLGGMDATRELHRDTRGLPALESIRQDLRYSIRTLRRDAGLAIFAILIIGLGVGASTTVFSVVNALLLRPLSFADPERLAWIANDGGEGLSAQTVQVGHLIDLRAQNQSFSEIAGYFAFYGVGDQKLTGTGEPERLTGVPVSENFFPLLGVKPQLGRLFTAEECRWNGPRAVLLGYRFWERRFASDPGIIGRALTLNDASVTVVGILPASFDFSAVFAPGSRVDLYLPFPLSEETNRWGNTLALIGRLKPGMAVEPAQAEMSLLGERITRDNPRRNDLKPRVTTLRKQVSGGFRSAIIVLVCAVGMVMLIVCANLSNLLLARMATREKEIAIRAALGAARSRLIRQMLTESLVLSCAGAALGLLLAVGGTRFLAQLDAVRIPLLEQIRVDAIALGFTVLIAVITGVLFGLAPAWRVSTPALQSALKEGGRGSSEGRRHGNIRATLVVCEVAFACVLLVGTGLLLRSFLRILDVDLGFQPQRAVTLRIDPSAVTLRIDPSSQNSTQALKNSYFDEALRRARAVPGIEAAGITDALPLGTNRSWGVAAKGKIYEPGHYPEAFVRVVSDGYLRALGIPLRAGRDFSAGDNPSSPRVIIINETLARTLWPGEDSLGKIMRADGEREVIGVVRDVRHLALEQESLGEMYLPIRQTNDYASVNLVVRGTLSPAGLAAGVREALGPIDPSLPANEFRTIQDLVDRSTSPRRLIVLLLSGFAGFALILASLGIYGVISYSVNQRKQEIGIRMALGASPGDLRMGILLQTIKLAAIGMFVGLVTSWSLGNTLRGLLFGITPSDPLTFAAALVLLMAVAALAGYLPARRASRLDPVEALRAE
jgi:putative ABC transport system permease protein